jgi:cytochrome c-type biogenesis protein CcmE
MTMTPQTAIPASQPLRTQAGTHRTKFILGFGLILAAIAYLIITNTLNNQQTFFTIQELNERGVSAQGRTIRFTGAVIGESIQYDSQSLTLSFTAVNIPADNAELQARGGLAQVLHEAVLDTSAPRITVVYVGPKPDLIKDEAQVIAVGRLGEDGRFLADEVTFKCPTRYEEAPSAGN